MIWPRQPSAWPQACCGAGEAIPSQLLATRVELRSLKHSKTMDGAVARAVRSFGTQFDHYDEKVQHFDHFDPSRHAL